MSVSRLGRIIVIDQRGIEHIGLNVRPFSIMSRSGKTDNGSNRKG